MEKIIVNRIRCKRCGDVIESMYTHDFKLCKCGAVGIDGGKEYLRREFDSKDDFQELSVVKEVEESKENTCKNCSLIGENNFCPVLGAFVDPEFQACHNLK